MHASLCLYKVCLCVFWTVLLSFQHLQNVHSLPVGARKVAGIGRGIVVFGMLKACRIYGLFRNDAEYFCEQFSEVVEIKGVLYRVYMVHAACAGECRV